MPTGKIKFFNVSKGYGFIERENAPDIYLNYRDIEKYGFGLKPGDKVEFEIFTENHRIRALNVRTDKTDNKTEHSITRNSSERNFREHDTRRSKSPKQGGQDAGYYYSQALVAKQNRNYEKARELFEKAAENGAQPEIFYAYAAMEKKIKLFDNARRIFERGINQFPKNSKLYEDYGMLERRRGNLQRAAEIFRKGIKQSPTHSILHLSLAQVLSELNDPELLQEEHFNIAKKRGQKQGYYHQALLAIQNRNYDKARELFERAAEHGAKREVFDAYAAMEKELGQFDNARRVFEKGINQFPKSSKLYENYGILERQRGNLKQAAEIYRKGIKQSSGYGILHLSLAQVLFELNDPELLREAEEHFDTANKRGLIRDSATQYQYRLVKVLLGGDYRGLLTEFIKAGFSIENISLYKEKDYAVDFTVKPKLTEYTESYDLSGEIFVRCFYKSHVSVKDIATLLKEFKNSRKFQHVSQDVLFLVLRKSSHLRDYLYSLLEKADIPTIVPFEESQIRLGSESDDSESLMKDVLDEWLYRRNLYDESFPVSGRRFFGREKVLAGLISNVDHGTPTGIFGLRKVGKTSLLNKLKEKRAQDIVIYIDLQAVPANIKDCNYLYWAMADQLISELQHNYPESEKNISFTLGGKYKAYGLISRPERLAAQLDADLRLVRSDLSESVKTASAKVLVLIDEIERMLPNSGNDGFSGFSDFFAYLRGMSQQEGFLISIITGANPAICNEPQWKGLDNPVFKYYQETFLPPFEKHECDEMIQKLGKGMGISYTEESLRHIYDETGGHPFITRQFCARIAKLFKKRPLLVDKTEVEQGIQEFLFHDTSAFREILDRLERDFPEEKKILLSIASGVKTEQELSTLYKSAIQDNLRHLTGYQLIERDRMNYRIKMGLLLKWIQKDWLNMED